LLQFIFYLLHPKVVISVHIVVVGLNYRTAPVEVRERFTIQPECLSDAIRHLKARKTILECVIVGTCNRTEIYAVVDSEYWCPNQISDFMESWFGIKREMFTPYTYAHENEEAIRHLFRVSSGLDSMILGETQILGQVRNAFLLAQQVDATGTIFNMLFKQAITVAKKAHAETAIGENPVSVSYAAVELGKQIIHSYENKKALIIGAGKMSELTITHLMASGAAWVGVVNRTLSKAEALAAKCGGHAHNYDQLHSLLTDMDVVISSTGSNRTILTKVDVEEVMKLRPTRSMFMIDIAVPRDLDPEIQYIPNVHLYDIDDLANIVESNMEFRRHAAGIIESMIADEIHIFHQWYRSLGVGPIIRALYSKASVIHNETMGSLKNKLPSLSEYEWKMVHKLTKSMLNQMMHDPIHRLKEMAPENNREEALTYFTKIFALENTMAMEHQDREEHIFKEPSNVSLA
jgi:glutamyl-tRNA reductase